MPRRLDDIHLEDLPPPPIPQRSPLPPRASSPLPPPPQGGSALTPPPQGGSALPGPPPRSILSPKSSYDGNTVRLAGGGVAFNASSSEDDIHVHDRAEDVHVNFANEPFRAMYDDGELVQSMRNKTASVMINTLFQE